MPIVDVDLSGVRSWDDFHDSFAAALGFPGFYGRNLDAWIDCLTGADDDDGMRDVVVEAGDVLTLNLVGARELRESQPEMYAAMMDCAAFVNWRRIEAGRRPILAISHR